MPGQLLKAYVADELHLDYADPDLSFFLLRYEREVMQWLSWLTGQGSRNRITLANKFAGKEAEGVDQPSDWFGQIQAGDIFEIILLTRQGLAMDALQFTVGKVVSRKDVPRSDPRPDVPDWKYSTIVLQGYAETVPLVLETSDALQLPEGW